MPTDVYICLRCNEQFFIKYSNKIVCPSCGNDKVNKKEINIKVYHPDEKVSIDKIIKDIDNKNIQRIQVESGRCKAEFACYDCIYVFHADCTRGVETVKCPKCKKRKNVEVKTPIVSVISGVKGLKNIQQELSLRERKIARFVKNCSKRRTELEMYIKSICKLFQYNELPKKEIDEIEKFLDKKLEKVDKIHMKKIDKYKEQLND